MSLLVNAYAIRYNTNKNENLSFKAAPVVPIEELVKDGIYGGRLREGISIDQLNSMLEKDKLNLSEKITIKVLKNAIYASDITIRIANPAMIKPRKVHKKVSHKIFIPKILPKPTQPEAKSVDVTLPKAVLNSMFEFNTLNQNQRVPAATILNA